MITPPNFYIDPEIAPDSIKRALVEVLKTWTSRVPVNIASEKHSIHIRFRQIVNPIESSYGFLRVSKDFIFMEENEEENLPSLLVEFVNLVDAMRGVAMIVGYTCPNLAYCEEQPVFLASSGGKTSYTTEIPNYDADTMHAIEDQEWELDEPNRFFFESFTSIVQNCYVQDRSVFLDCSSNGIPRMSYLRFVVRSISMMGLNRLYLYIQNAVEISRPMHDVEDDDFDFFNYARCGYRFDELKKFDEYARVFGIEVVPAMNVLGDMQNFLQYPQNQRFKDTSSILCCDDPDVHNFIARLLKLVSGCFKTELFHICLSDAIELGTGNYRLKYSDRNICRVFLRQLQSIYDICRSLNIRPLIWSDMLLRLNSVFFDYYDANFKLPAFATEFIPEDISIALFDYIHTDEAKYDQLVKRHVSLLEHVKTAANTNARTASTGPATPHEPRMKIEASETAEFMQPVAHDSRPKRKRKQRVDYTALPIDACERISANLQMMRNELDPWVRSRLAVSTTIWSYARMWTDMTQSIRCIAAMMASAKSNDVRETIACIFFDDGTEVDPFSALPPLQYYADSCYNINVPLNRLGLNFWGSVNANWEHFFKAETLDRVSVLENAIEANSNNLSKFLLWEDPILSVLQPQVDQVDLSTVFSSLSDSLFAYSKDDSYLLSARLALPSRLAHVLALKVELQKELRKAYDEYTRRREDLPNRDADVVSRKLLTRFLKDIDTLVNNIESLWRLHHNMFLDVFRPCGLECLEVRYGGLIIRLRSLKMRLQQFIEGGVDSLDELGFKRRKVYPGSDNQLPFLNYRQCTTSFIGRWYST
ncbi:hypothetical protein PCE1_004577 [Barthelona sp. PCE]